ncbi:MAG: hypothetical protein OEY19_02985 [Gammaproteobacteria bacterium]|nr:hypothetical protein [Gammaproteobacteria bacterium]MDH5630169.1 hypothetical protein [Gammaproteobacteria bacterium]
MKTDYAKKTYVGSVIMFKSILNKIKRPLQNIKRPLGWIQFNLIFLIVFNVTTVQASENASSPFEDDESCLTCHKYPRMMRVTDEGTIRSYYIMPDVYANTVHRNVPCRDCHTNIQQLPHEPVEKGVSCDTQCHSIKNPATGKPFSHKVIVDAYSQSVHGREKVETGIESDKPYCITCHNNPIYDPIEQAPPEHIVSRCVLCHEDGNFVQQWYKHTSRRIREVKNTSAQIVQLCSACHGDEKLVTKHIEHAKKEGRELGEKFAVAVESYNDSFHGKLTNYGFGETANCLDCHAEQENYYKSVHEIKPSRDPESPVHKDNRVETCQQCHSLADENFASLDPHPTTKTETGVGVFRSLAEKIYNMMSVTVIFGLLGLAIFETIGRRRDGVSFVLRKSTSWRRKSKRGRDRV